MAKQQRPKTDKSRLLAEEVDQITADVTGKETKPDQPGITKPSFTLADTNPPKERQPGLTNKGRVKFTTMLKPDLRNKLQNVADNNGLSVADVLEKIVIEYFALGGGK